jgi:hypothetical protein
VVAGNNYTIHMRLPMEQGNRASSHMFLLGKSFKLAVEQRTHGNTDASNPAAADQATTLTDAAGAATPAASAVTSDLQIPTSLQPCSDHSKPVMQLHQTAVAAHVELPTASSAPDVKEPSTSSASIVRRQLQGALLEADVGPVVDIDVAATDQDDYVHSSRVLESIHGAYARSVGSNTSTVEGGTSNVSHSQIGSKTKRMVPLERGQLYISLSAADAIGIHDFSGSAAVEPTATKRVIWGVPTAPIVRSLPVVPKASIAPAASSMAAAVHVLNQQDYPVPVISLPNQGVLSLMETTPLQLDGSNSMGSEDDAIVSWSWALRMISPQEVDLTTSIDQSETEPMASVSLTVPGSYVVGLTVQAASGAAHYNNTALIVLSGNGMGAPSGTGILPQSAGGASPPFPNRLRLRYVWKNRAKHCLGVCWKNVQWHWCMILDPHAAAGVNERMCILPAHCQHTVSA